jgi:hypothetical protein
MQILLTRKKHIFDDVIYDMNVAVPSTLLWPQQQLQLKDDVQNVLHVADDV